LSHSEDIAVIGWIFEDLLYEVICFWIGFMFLKSFTFARFPNHRQTETLKERIKLTGVVVLIVGLITIGWIAM